MKIIVETRSIFMKTLIVVYKQYVIITHTCYKQNIVSSFVLIHFGTTLNYNTKLVRKIYVNIYIFYYTWDREKMYIRIT